MSTFIGAVLGPILAVVEGEIAMEFNVSINQAALLAGYPLLTTGCMAWIAQAICPVLGKRIVYLICSSILFATTIWNIYVTSYGEFLACRTVQGLGNGAFEAVVLSTIGDMYFVRNSYAAIHRSRLIYAGPPKRKTYPIP
jgi:nitrate/nitrite transporter NarK